jgi:hypothetical protein
LVLLLLPRLLLWLVRSATRQQATTAAACCSRSLTLATCGWPLQVLHVLHGGVLGKWCHLTASVGTATLGACPCSSSWRCWSLQQQSTQHACLSANREDM